MRPLHRWLAFGAVVLVPVLVPSVARASSEADEAQKLDDEGQAALDKKLFHTAMDRFRRADIGFHSPLHTLGLARAEAGAGLVVLSHGHYATIVEEGAPKDAPPRITRALDDARTEMAQVAMRLATAVIVVSGPEHPTVLLDHKHTSWSHDGKRSIDPGTHVVRVEASGYRPAEARFTVLEGNAATVSLSLALDPKTASAEWLLPESEGDLPRVAKAPAADAPETSGRAVKDQKSVQWMLGYTGLGAGAAGIATGIVAAVVALNKRDAAAQQCVASTCPASVQDDLHTARAWSTASTAGFIVGGLGVIGGIALLSTLPKTEPRVSPYVGLGSIGATGAF